MKIDELASSAGAYLSLVASYRMRRTVLSRLPVLYWIEPTGRCNLKCRMCINASLSEKSGGMMDMDTYRSVLDQIAAQYPADVATVALFLGGEPFLHPEIFAMIRYARQKRVKVQIATNATLLNDRAIDLLLESPPNLLILSFDGYDKGSYERARIGARFESVLGNIIHLLEEKRKRALSQPAIRVYSLILDRAHEAAERGRFAAFFAERLTGLGVDEFLVENAGGTAWLAENEQIAAESPAAAPIHAAGGPGYLPCVRLWYTMSILWDGTVVPCCTDFTGRQRLGNVGTNTLQEIWNGPAYREMRQRMVQRRLPKVCAEGCGVIFPADALFGIPGELLIHRKMIRDMKNRIRARASGPKE